MMAWVRTAIAVLALGLVASGPGSSDEQLLTKVAAAIRHNHLAPSRCLSFVVDHADPTITVVHVSRQHGGSCGGDPELDEHLFDVDIDGKTGRMTTNAGDPELLEQTPLSP